MSTSSYSLTYEHRVFGALIRNFHKNIISHPLNDAIIVNTGTPHTGNTGEHKFLLISPAFSSQSPYPQPPEAQVKE